MSAHDVENVVYFDYRPRPGQDVVLREIDGRPRSVLVAHRRWGKTEAMALRLLLAAMHLDREHPTPLFAYIGPFLNQARSTVWGRLKFYSRVLPGVQINETDSIITLWNGAAIRVFGADYPDRLRGLGFDGVVMDEVAQMRPETWPAVVLPALADRDGWAVFIGTPKGQNVFYNLYLEGLEKGWFVGVYPADQSAVFSKDKLEELRSEMGDNLYRQELLCDFTADNANVFIDFQSVQEAMGGERPAGNDAPLVFGLDVARFGDDRTVLLQRRGRVVEKIDVWRGRDLMWTASETAAAIELRRPRAVFVDSVGLGAGVVDRLRQLGHRVIAVNSGSRSGSPKFVNLKAEIWDKMRLWLAEGAVLPDDPALRADLLAPSYDYDANGRLKIESKDDLKKRGLPSTDLADALALTFAQPVAHAGLAARRPKYAEM